jgi:hypothetical protein
MTILTSSDQETFKEWLGLNTNNITWEGRYENEFNSFWSSLFQENISIEEQIDKINKALLLSKSGPLISWFQWLKNKFICFLFVSKGFSVIELSNRCQYEMKEVALLLRDFFVERYPHLEGQISEHFHVSHIISESVNLKFLELVQKYQMDKETQGTLNDDILKSLEITLYKDWGTLSEKLSLKNSEIAENIIEIKKNVSLKKQFKFIQDLLVLFLIGGLFIAAVKFGNEWYEKKLVKEITLFEPNFFWLDKEVNYQSENPLNKKPIDLDYKELDDLEKIESEATFSDVEKVNRYEVESDVVLTSVNSIPQDFTSADLEQSAYEEKKKGGYRNVRYGGRKAYRVMMTSESPGKTKKELIDILKKYNVKQVDNVKPGTSIPGGIYFNLHVPRNVVDEFLSRVSNVKESRILESKTVFRGPKGTNKVFIWIKQI